MSPSFNNRTSAEDKYRMHGIIKELYLTDIYRTLHPTTEKYALISYWRIHQNSLFSHS